MTDRTLDRWIGLSREELDRIYRGALPGSLPRGDTRGTAIVTGAGFPRLLAHVARRLAWQGKVFDIFAEDGESGVLVNKVLPLGLGLIVAKVYREPSWLDGRETIVIDYSRTSLLARAIRDEIRQVEPGLWLGKVWWGRTRVLDFALSASPGALPAVAGPNAPDAEADRPPDSHAAPSGRTPVPSDDGAAEHA